MATRIPKQFIDDVLARTDIVACIDARVPLRKMGANYAACCPFHNEKTPSFTVSPSKQFYHCFGCGVSGNAISFLIDFERLEFVEAVETLASQLGMEIPYTTHYQSQTAIYKTLHQLMEQIATFYQQQLRQQSFAIDYLKSRGISGQIAKEFGLGYAPAGWDNLLKHLGHSADTQQHLLTCGMMIKKEDGSCYDRFRERIMFPIRDRRGNVIAFGGRIMGNEQPKYLNSPETTLFHKGHELYGLYEARRANRELPRLLIVEGYMDLIALAQHGIRNVVATLGTATTEDHLKLLFRLTNEIVFCFDGDRAGKEAAWRALTTALPLMQDGFQLNFMFLPDGEDPDSLIRSTGEKAFHQHLVQATPLSDFFFSHLGEELDLNSIEGKGRLAKPAGELLSKMPPSVFRQRMFDRLATIVRVESQQLQSLAGIKPTVTSSTKRQRKPSLTKINQFSPVRLAVALLLQNPQLIENISNNDLLKDINLPGISLFQQLITQLKERPLPSTGAILEDWRNTPEITTLTKLAAWEYFIPADGLAAEFNGILMRIQQMGREQKIQQLLTKATQQGLSIEEKKYLQELIIASKV